ncbi:PREDICTED: probable cytochrome P450 6d2, partial [Rhagoletis zephyria]|uniref:probable cytochrome P450 6d2 n=1 Tax=Rhagoletis zephyria TaxID=28612 RepID=UPI0008118736
MWFVLISVAIVAITLLIRRHFTYWERQGIPSDKPVIPFGSLKDTVFGIKDVGSAIHHLHERYKKPFVGIYLLFKPTLLITDLELARQVLIQNFVSFHDRGIDSTVSPDLFSMRGASWKNLRSKLTPLFSSGKLKAMLPTINDVAAKLLNHLDEQLVFKSVVEVEMKDMMFTYSLDVIGSVFFGMDVDSFKNPKNEYRTVIGEVLSPSAWLDRIKSVSFFVCPPLSTFMEYCGYTPNGVLEIREIIKRVVNLREHKNVVRRDFIQLLLQLRNSNKITDDDNWSLEKASEDAKSMSIEMIGDQCSLFSIAGTETTAVTAAHTLYELSMYPELLTEAVAEVDSVLSRHGLEPSDPLTYEAIQDMKFLELCTM